MVHLIAGRAGSGKSRLIYRMAETAIKDGKRVYLIVPDQATFQTEVELARRRPTGALAGSGVLSFSRLCDRVLSETSGARRPVLDERGAVMAVSALLTAHKDEFSTFGGYVSSPGFAALLYTQLCELRRFSIRPVHLLSTGSPRARDIALVMQAYEDEVLSRYTDAVGRMEMMVERIPLSPMLKGTHVFIDGFEMVTDQLMRAVQALMETCEDVTVSFRLGRENDRDFPIFETELGHYKRVEQAALKAGQKIHPIPLYGGDADYRQQSPMLRHLEQELFSLPRNVYRGPYDGSILLREAAHGRQEAAAAARYICYLVREEGMRYRDIFVQLCDPSLLGFVREAFSDHGIPCFFDEKRPVMSRAVCRFALSFLRCAAFGFQRDDVLSLLKTGLFPITTEDCARVQSWFTRSGVRYLSAAAVERVDEESLSALLSAIRAPMAALGAKLKEGSCRVSARAFYSLIASYESAITDFIGRLSQSDLEAADQERMAYTALVDILTQMDTMMAEIPMGPTEFYQTLRAGLMAQEIAVLPPTADCVSVGDMERSRAASVRCLMVLGANDGCLPRTIRPTGILPERDKEAMTQAGLWLGNDILLRMAEEEWTIYGAFTKPKERLYISYSAMDQKGSPRQKSSVISDLTAIFPQLPLYPAESYRSTRGYGSTPLSAAQSALSAGAAYTRGEAVNPEFSTLYRAAMEELSLNDLHVPERGRLSPETARAMFLPTGAVSATMMERYARCPFAHFIDYGLRPDELTEPGVAPKDRGNILHAVMETLTRTCTDWSLPEEEIRRLAREAALQAFTQYQSTPAPRDDYQLRQLIAYSEQAAIHLFSQMNGGDFTPQRTEFRREVPLTVPGREQPIRLIGKIDRVDAATVHGKRYIRVVDYKSGKAKYDETSFTEGTDLQLPIYAAAAKETFHSDVAGMFLMPIGRGSTGKLDGIALGEKAVITAMDHALTEGNKSEIIPVGYKKDGAFTAASAVREPDDMENILSRARIRAGELAADMLSGNSAPAPNERTDPCRYCAYAGICGYTPEKEAPDHGTDD